MSESFQGVSPTENALASPQYDLDAGIIRCICGLEDDDGFTIQCERCYVWQHAVCVGIDQLHVPDEYLCDLCSPRPLDVKKAIEKQRHRREQESTSNSHVRRRRHLPYGLVKSKMNAAPMKEKPLSPSIKHENTRKPRSNHRSYFHKDAESRFQVSELVNGSNVDADSYFNYNSEYSTIKHNLITSINTQTYISHLLQDKSLTLMVSDDCFSPKHLPSTSIRSALNTDLSSLLCFSLYANQLIPSSQIIKEFKGEVYLQDEYKVNSINQYSFLLAPKPYVYFISDSKLCVDTRRYGTDSRFIRRSCKPNSKLITVASSDNSYIHLALYSMTEIHPGLEITIGWDWDVNHPANILENQENISDDEIKYSQELIYFIDGLECACELGKECTLSKLRRVFSTLSKNNIKSTKKRAIPLLNTNHDIDNDGLDGSIPQMENGSDSMNKSQNEVPESLVRVPSGINSISNGTLSAREERKIKDILARIEKLEQEETQITKKRKQRSDGKSGENYKTCGYHRKVSSTVLPKRICQQSTSPPVSLLDSPKELSSVKPHSQRPGRIPSRIARMQKHRKITNDILKEYSEDADINEILPCKKMWMRRWIQENLKIDTEKIMKKDKQKLKNGITESEANVHSETPKDIEIADAVKHENPPLSSDMVLLGQLLPGMESSDKLSLDFASPEPAISAPISELSQLSDKFSTPSLFKPDLGFSTTESRVSSFTIASPLTSELEPIQSTVLPTSPIQSAALFTSPASVLDSFPKKISLSEYRKRKSVNEELTLKDKYRSDDAFNLSETLPSPNNNCDFKIENSENGIFSEES